MQIAQKIEQPPNSKKQLPFLRRISYAVLVSGALLFSIFAAAEITLRLTNSGYDTNFFSAVDDDYVTTNPFFIRRFFGDAVEPRSANIIHFSSDKTVGRYRIFVLGGSAAMGVPTPNFNFGRFLQVMLELAYPEHEFEVINTAMTSINSHVVREIADECTEHAPDLFIVYMGNNEVIGPYGPATAFETLSSSLWLIRASLFLKKTFIGQWFNSLLTFADGTSRTGWDGMQMFSENNVPADDSRLDRVYRQFAANLTAICRSAERVGAKVLLCSVAVNLRDCPPFSVTKSSSEEECKNSRDLTNEISREAIETGHYSPQWINPLRKRLIIDSQNALLEYLLGHCFLAAGENQNAFDAFVRARNLDALRFRVDSRINEIIFQIAQAEKRRGVSFVDIEKSLNVESPGGICGKNYFYEHAHFTHEGQYAVAQTLFKKVCAQLPAQITAGKRQQPKAASYDTCALLLALTDLEKFRAIKENLEMTNKPPFVNQHFHHKRASRQRAQLASFSAKHMAKDREWLRTIYLSASQQKPDDLILQFLAARFLLASGRTEESLPILTKLSATIPNNYQMLLLLANALHRLGKRAEAALNFQKALAASPDQAMTLSEIAAAHLQAGRIVEAIDYGERAHARKPDRINTMKLLAIIHFNAKNFARAEKLFESVHAQRDQDRFVIEKLIFLCLERNDHNLAAKYAKEFLAKQPNDPLVRTYYAIALREMGNIDSAATEYEKILSGTLDDRDPLKIDVKKQFRQIKKSHRSKAQQGEETQREE